MKLTVFFLIIGLLSAQAKGVSQTITLTGNAIPMKEVFAAIKDQTGYVVAGDYDLLKGLKPLQIKADRMPLKQFLTFIFKDQPLSYRLDNTTIFIFRKHDENKDLMSDGGSLVPPIEIKGRVLNENGDPLDGASITLKGTGFGAKTDNQGYYKIENIPPGEYTLVATYVGYTTTTKSINLIENAATPASINFKLQLNPYGFNDVFVSANLVASKKKEIASAVTTITSKQIEQLQINNVAQLFRGEVPGGISFNYGQGSSIYNSIKLRGDVDFWSAESTVKIILDGVELSNPSYLTTLPLSAIEKIEILRGPQASTLYGSGATSGVLYIYTKKGKDGFSIDAKVSGGTISSKYVDKTAYQQDHSLNVSAGNESISYNVGGSYFKQDPYWPEGGSKTKSVFGGIKGKSGPFTTELMGQYSEANIKSSLNPILKETFPSSLNFTTAPHQSYNQTQQTLGVSFTYNPFTWWQNNASLGIDQTNIATIQTEPRYIYPTDTLNSRSYNNLQKKSYRYFTTFKIPLGRIINAKITAGFDHYTYENSYFNVSGLGNDPNFSPIGGASTSLSRYSNTGFYAQSVVGLLDKLFLTAGMRSESTKQFGNSSGSSVAPKFGLSYVMSVNESFSTKIRTSYGKSIKVPNPDYFIEKRVDYPQYGYTLVQIGNPNLKPQEQTGYDVGVDLELGKGIGTFEATYYNQYVNNFIIGNSDFSNFPPLYVVQYINVGKIINKGLELAGTLNLNALKFRFTYSITSSKVADISGTNYTTYYEKGDRIWGIPKSSGGATITYDYSSLFKYSKRTLGSLSLGITYFNNWINTDFVSLNRDLLNFDYSHPYSYYAMEYPEFAQFNLGLDYHVTKNVTCFLNINNLFNNNAFEFDNSNPTQGRLTVLGVKFSK